MNISKHCKVKLEY